MSNFKPSHDSTVIESFFSTAPHGAFISYADIESATSVTMDNAGKSALRQALNRLKLPYDVRRGEGVELCGKDNAERIIAGKIRRIDTSVKNADKTQKQVCSLHLPDMDEDTKKRILLVGSALGAIIAASRQYKEIMKPAPSNNSYFKLDLDKGI